MPGRTISYSLGYGLLARTNVKINIELMEIKRMITSGSNNTKLY